MSEAKVVTLTWTIESDTKDEQNYALFVSGAGQKVQMSGWLDSPTMVMQEMGKGLSMPGAPHHEAPE